MPAAVIGSIGCLFIAAYSLIYTYTASMFLTHSDGVLNSIAQFKGWGLSFTPTTITDGYFAGWIAATLFWVLLVLNCAHPFINDLFLMLTNKNYKQALMWQRLNKKGQIVVDSDLPPVTPTIIKN
ncbi:MAG: hypothetical protein HUJ52_03855 [Malacoplasma sp.]|nr:hypothetical protein [Malacoplasma sp.]